MRRIVQITSLVAVPEADLVARLERLASVPPEARSRAMVQLRDPELAGGELLRLGTGLRAITRRLGMGLVVNDRLDLAYLIGADGVHLGGRSVSVAEAREFLGRPVWVSVACHSSAEVITAAEQGADAALLSPIFASPGKGTPIGTSAIEEARDLLRSKGRGIEVIALGGIDAMNAVRCFEAGADGVAAIRADLGTLLQSAGGTPRCGLSPHAIGRTMR